MKNSPTPQLIRYKLGPNGEYQAKNLSIPNGYRFGTASSVGYVVSQDFSNTAEGKVSIRLEGFVSNDQWEYNQDTDEIRRLSTEGIDNPDNYVIERRYFTARDGARVGMFFIRHKNAKLEANNNPVIVNAYGRGVGLYPALQDELIPYLQRGGGLAIINVRGAPDGEGGEAWQKAGSGENIMNSRYDVEDSVKFLIDSGETSLDKVALLGESNGGSTVTGDIGCKAMVLINPTISLAEIGDHPSSDNWRADFGNWNDPKHHKLLTEGSIFAKTLKALGNGEPITQPQWLLLLSAINDKRINPEDALRFVLARQALERAIGLEGYLSLLNYNEDGHAYHGEKMLAMMNMFFILALGLPIERLSGYQA